MTQEIKGDGLPGGVDGSAGATPTRSASRRKPKEYPCDLSSTGKCQYGGAKAFNYGFMWGSHDVCRHPVHRLHKGRARPIYPVLMDGPIKCPLITEAERSGAGEASEPQQDPVTSQPPPTPERTER